MEEVAAIKDIGTILTARNISNGSRSAIPTTVLRGISDAARAGPSALWAGHRPVRSFNYVEEVKGPDHEKYPGQTPRSPLPPIW